MTAVDRIEWLTARQAGIGASDVACLAGLSPWGNQMSVWISKTQPIVEEGDMTDAQWLGLVVEDGILNGFEERHGVQVIDRQRSFTHPEHPTHMATPDGIAVGIGPIDAKFISGAPWNDDGTPENVAEHYLCQSQWQMHVTGHDKAVLAVIHTAFSRRFWRVYTIERNQKVIDSLVAIADDFWGRYVVPKRLPPVDGTEASAEALKVMFPQHVEAAVEIDADIAARWLKAKAAASNAVNDLAEAEQLIKQALGENDTACVDGKPVFTWRTQTSRRIDAKAVVELLGDQTPYQESTSRVFRQKGKK